MLDRTAPVVAINASSTSVKVGEAVSFQASASDATSGLAGAGQWMFGDTTAIGSGDTIAHTYTQPGTYEVTLTVKDAAGNAATATKSVTVSTTTPPDDGDDPTDPGEEPGAESLDVDAPRRARARAKFIPVQLTATDRGKVQLWLLDGEKALADATVRLDPDGTADHRLRLTKGTKPGRYVLKATWKVPGRQTMTITELRNIRLIKSPPVRRRASASTAPGVTVAPGPRALPDGRFHGARPALTFKVR